MKILLVGGFLGVGKTTLIRGILRKISESGGTAALIENEIGAGGIDDQLLQDTALSITPLFGGCVCCQIAGDLIDAVRQIKKELHPDWLVLEATGLAFLSELRDVIDGMSDPELEVHSICVVDSGRWARLMRAAPDLMKSQLEGADVIVVNKIDLHAPEAGELDNIQEHSGGNAPVLCVSPEDRDGLWEKVQTMWGV